jgi:hypothetical protein
MATSTQDMVRPGECIDVYYYDAATAKKECFPTTQNTKFTQNFQNNSGGTSVFTIPPQNGIQDVVCSFAFTLTDERRRRRCSAAGLGLRAHQAGLFPLWWVQSVFYDWRPAAPESLSVARLPVMPRRM